jgi:hypothetical protein
MSQGIWKHVTHNLYRDRFETVNMGKSRAILFLSSFHFIHTTSLSVTILHHLLSRLTLSQTSEQVLPKIQTLIGQEEIKQYHNTFGVPDTSTEEGRKRSDKYEQQHKELREGHGSL